MLSSGAERYLILVVLLFPWVLRLGRLLRASGRNSPDHVDPPPTLPVGVAGSDAPVRFGPSAWVLALVVGGWAATTAVLASHQNSLAIIPLGWPGGLIVLAVLLQNPSVRADEEGLTVRNSVWPRRIRWSDIAALTAEASTWRMPGRHNSVAGYRRQRLAKVSLVVHRRSGRSVTVGALRTTARNVPASARLLRRGALADARARELQRRWHRAIGQNSSADLTYSFPSGWFVPGQGARGSMQSVPSAPTWNPATLDPVPAPPSWSPATVQSVPSAPEPPRDGRLLWTEGPPGGSAARPLHPASKVVALVLSFLLLLYFLRFLGFLPFHW